MALRVGPSVTKRAKKINETVLVDGHASDSRRTGTVHESSTNTKYRGLCYFKNSGDYHTGRGSKGWLNEYLEKKNVLIKGEGVFGELSGSGFISPFSGLIRALLKLINLICGHVTGYKTFKEPQHIQKDGLKPLIRAPKEIMKRTTPVEDRRDPVDAEKDVDVSAAPKDKKRKRAEYEESHVDVI